jgi:hypothetical protein
VNCCANLSIHTDGIEKPLEVKACSACCGDYEDPDRTAWSSSGWSDEDWSGDELDSSEERLEA